MIIAICFVLFAYLVMFFKTKNAYENQAKILDAIVVYGESTEEYEKGCLMLDNMESYPRTLFRFWDWGYENILPKEDFELIKPYIQEK